MKICRAMRSLRRSQELEQEGMVQLCSGGHLRAMGERSYGVCDQKENVASIMLSIELSSEDRVCQCSTQVGRYIPRTELREGVTALLQNVLINFAKATPPSPSPSALTQLIEPPIHRSILQCPRRHSTPARH